MRANTIKESNGTKVEDKSFKTILEQMMKLTSGGDIKVANKHWNIHYKPQSSNNVDYGSPIGA